MTEGSPQCIHSLTGTMNKKVRFNNRTLGKKHFILPALPFCSRAGYKVHVIPGHMMSHANRMQNLTYSPFSVPFLYFPNAGSRKVGDPYNTARIRGTN